MPTKSFASLSSYHQHLLRLSGAPMDTYHPETREELAELHRLRDAGLIHIGSSMLSGKLQGVQITPAGATQLAMWEEFLFRNSAHGKLVQGASRFAWLLTGVALSLISQALERWL